MLRTLILDAPCARGGGKLCQFGVIDWPVKLQFFYKHDAGRVSQ